MSAAGWAGAWAWIDCDGSVRQCPTGQITATARPTTSFSGTNPPVASVM